MCITCRSLLHHLSPLLQLAGVWECVALQTGAPSNAHRAGSASHTGRIVAFRWLPNALVCLQLQDCVQAAMGLQWKVCNVLSADSPSLPSVEHLTRGSLLLKTAVRLDAPLHAYR